MTERSPEIVMFHDDINRMIEEEGISRIKFWLKSGFAKKTPLNGDGPWICPIVRCNYKEGMVVLDGHGNILPIPLSYLQGVDFVD